MLFKNNDVISYIKKSNYQFKDELIKTIKTIGVKEKISFNDDTFLDFIKFIIQNNIEFNRQNIDKIKDLFLNIIYDDENKEEYNLFLKLINPYINSKLNTTQFETLYYLFSDKKYVVNILNRIANFQTKSIKNKKEIIEKYLNYILESRIYYVDETSFFASLSSLENVIFSDAFLYENIDIVIKKQLSRDEKMAGLYNIDIDEVKEYDKKITELQNDYKEASEELLNAFEGYVEKVDKQDHSFNNIDKKIDEEIEHKTFHALEKIKEQANLRDKKSKELLNSINSSLNKFNKAPLKPSNSILNSFKEIKDFIVEKTINIDLDEKINEIILKKIEEGYDHQNIIKLLNSEIDTNLDKDLFYDLLENRFDVVMLFIDHLDTLEQILKINPYYNNAKKYKDYNYFHIAVGCYGIEEVANKNLTIEKEEYEKRMQKCKMK